MPSIGSLCVGSFYSFIFLSYNHSPEKWYFPALKSLLLPQFLTYRYRSGFIVKGNRCAYRKVYGKTINWKKKKKKNFKVVYFAPKNWVNFLKNLAGISFVIWYSIVPLKKMIIACFNKCTLLPHIYCDQKYLPFLAKNNLYNFSNGIYHNLQYQPFSQLR